MSYVSLNVNKPYLDSRRLSEDFLKQVCHNVRVAEYSVYSLEVNSDLYLHVLFTFDLVPVRLSGIQA